MANVIEELRGLTPLRPVTIGEAMRIAELQANRLLHAMDIDGPPVPDSIITELPRLRVERLSPIPVSGSTHWSKGRWNITLNAAEGLFRQRFSLAHEFKHVIDHPFMKFLYPAWGSHSADDRAEQIADYFAACLLMPRAWIKRAWRENIQELPDLSRLFAVSQAAINVRLNSIGLTEPRPRCKAA